MNAHARPLDNYTNEHLADEIGAADRDAKEVAARLEVLKDEAKRRGIETATGERWKIAIDTGERTSLDTKALREAHPRIAAKFERTTRTCTLRISAVFQQPEVVG